MGSNKVKWKSNEAVEEDCGRGADDDADLTESGSSEGEEDGDGEEGGTTTSGAEVSDGNDTDSKHLDPGGERLSNWDRSEKEAHERRLRDVSASFRRSKLLVTRYVYSLPNPMEEEAAMIRQRNGLSREFKYSMSERERPPRQPVVETALGLASNVSVRPEGGGTMRVGDLEVALSSMDLTGEIHSQRGASSRGDAAAMGFRQGAGDGLDAGFRRALPLVCSGTAFLDDDGSGDEFKVKNTKLRSGMPKPKKKKKKKKKALATVDEGKLPLGDQEARATKPQRRRRRKRPTVDLDPIKTLARNTSVPQIQVELQILELHRMRTQKSATSFLPDLPVKRRPPPASSSARSLGPSGIGSGRGGLSRWESNAPISPHQMVADLSARRKPPEVGPEGIAAAPEAGQMEKSNKVGAMRINDGAEVGALQGAKTPQDRRTTEGSGLRSAPLAGLHGAKPGLSGLIDRAS